MAVDQEEEDNASQAPHEGAHSEAQKAVHDTPYSFGPLGHLCSIIGGRSMGMNTLPQPSPNPHPTLTQPSPNLHPPSLNPNPPSLNPNPGMEVSNPPPPLSTLQG